MVTIRYAIRHAPHTHYARQADIVAFDAVQVSDRHASGIVYILVNGVPVVEAGRHTGARPGRALRRA